MRKSMKREFKNVVGIATVATACVPLPATAADLVLLQGLTSEIQGGDPVQLQEEKPGACRYLGAFRNEAYTASSFMEKTLSAGGVKLRDLSIEVTAKSCDGVVSPVKMIIPLSQTHTYLDTDGKQRPGYAPGDVVAKLSPAQGKR